MCLTRRPRRRPNLTRMCHRYGELRGSHIEGEDENLIRTIKSNAPETPEHTGFVGCGDYAAAGALHAHLHRLAVADKVNGFIRRKLWANVVKPERERSQEA